MALHDAQGAAVSLPRIRGFLAVAQHLNFHRAAEELGITQPALSGQIKALEDVLHAKLFTRTTRRVRLTADGERCLLRARRLLDDFEAAVVDMRDTGEPQRGKVAFSCIPSILGYLFPRLVREFKRHHPDVALEMTDDTTVSMERRLLSREVDFGIGGPPYLGEQLDFAPVVDDPFVLVCPAAHPLANQSRVSLRRAFKYPMISLAKGSNTHNMLSAHCARLGKAFATTHELVHHHSVFRMVEAGMGVALLPSMTCDVVKSISRLRIVPLDDPTWVRPVGLIKRRGAPLSPAAHELYMLAARTISAAQPKRSGGKGR